MLLNVLAFSQTRVITGVVLGGDNQPVSGATINIRGTTTSVSASATGEFRINARTGDVLVISATNYGTREVSVGTGNSISVSLTRESAVIEEVVVTAAGGIRVRPREQGYNSTVVRSEALTAARPVNVAAGLMGKVAGLNISGVSSGVNPNFRIVLRGMRSLTGNNEALIVLDNVIVPNAVLSNLNPDDVESVNVLNGPSAAALYGSEASNGALLVTTKKGTKGRTTLRVAHTTMLEQVAFFPRLQTKFGSGATGDIQVYDPVENQQYGPAFDGILRDIGHELADGRIEQVPYSATNERKKFWADGVTQQTDFSMSTGSDRSTLYFSGQYAGVQGTTPGDAYNRASLRLNGTNRITNHLDLNFTAGYTQNRYDITTATGTVFDQLLQAPAQIPITRYKDWRNNPFADPSGYFNAFYNNPYFTIDNNRQLNRNDYFVGSAELKFAPISWMDFTYRLGISTRNQSNTDFTGKYTFTDFAKAQGSYKSQDIVGAVTEGSSYLTRLNSDLMVGLRKDADAFTFKLVLGGSIRQDESRSQSASISGLVIPGLYNLGNSSNPPSASEANYLARQFGIYGDFTVGYNNYLFLHATSRNDWVSILSPENRSFFYPSVDVSFIASDAISAIKNLPALNMLKLRAGWSKVGQVNLGGNFGAYRLNPTFSQGAGFPYAGAGGFTVGDQIVSSNLEPEITTGWEAGFDANFFKQRLTTNFTWFSTRTKNQTVSTGVANSTGYSSFLTNTGLTASKGAEVSVNVTPIRTRDWNVTVGTNYTFSDNKVIEISEDLPRLTLGAFGSGAGSYAVAGQPFPVLMGTTHKRDPEGRIIVNRITGYPSATDTISILGSATPRHILGLNFNVGFKAFKLSALAEYRGGHFIYNSVSSSLDFSGSSYNSALFNRQRFVIPNSSYLDASGKYVANTNITVRDGGPGLDHCRSSYRYPRELCNICCILEIA
jgi:TonB-linked SusC/RagA family outer membrane protein